MQKNLKSFFRLLRIKDWRAYFLMASFGFFVSKGFLFPLKDIILFYAIILLCLAFGFAVNECFDTKEDKYSKDRINPVANEEISFKNSLVFSVLPGVLGLVISLMFGLKIFLFYLTGLLIGFFYSAPPLRMKSRPFLDLISHGLFAGVFLVILPVLIFSPQLTLLHYLIALSFFSFSMILELRNHLEDYETDKRAGLKTTVCALGYKKSQDLLMCLAILFPLTLLPIFLFLYKNYLFSFFIFTFLFLLLALFSKDEKISKKFKLMDAYAISSFVLLLIISG